MPSSTIVAVVNASLLELISLFLIVGPNNPGATPQQQSFMLRVRRALDHPDYPWQLRYLGQPELGKNLVLLCWIHFQLSYFMLF